MAKYWRTVFQVVMLSEGDIPPSQDDREWIAYAIEDGVAEISIVEQGEDNEKIIT